MMAGEDEPASKKRKEPTPATADDIPFDFESEEMHAIFQMPDQVSGPDANTVVADAGAVGDLKFIIGHLTGMVMVTFEIELYQPRGLSYPPDWVVPEGAEKYKARIEDMNGFVRQLDKRRIPVVVWSTFRKLVVAFAAIEELGEAPQRTRVALDKAAVSSGFLPDAKGIYYYDPSKTKAYAIYGPVGIPSSYLAPTPARR